MTDGTTIYLTRDLGGAYDKWNKYKFDKHIYVVQAAQSLHFRQLYKTLELMDEEYAGRFEHVSFGMVTGMSTRKGTVKFLDDILDEATDVMHEAMRSNEAKYAQVEDPEKTSEIIGASAVKIQDMAGRRYVLDVNPLMTASTTMHSISSDAPRSKVISARSFSTRTSASPRSSAKTPTPCSPSLYPKSTCPSSTTPRCTTSSTTSPCTPLRCRAPTSSRNPLSWSRGVSRSLTWSDPRGRRSRSRVPSQRSKRRGCSCTS